MTRETIILILVIIVGLSTAGLLIWRDYKVVERKYQDCLIKCSEQNNPFTWSSVWETVEKAKVCQAECKEKY